MSEKAPQWLIDKLVSYQKDWLMTLSEDELRNVISQSEDTQLEIFNEYLKKIGFLPDCK